MVKYSDNSFKIKQKRNNNEIKCKITENSIDKQIARCYDKYNKTNFKNRFEKERQESSGQRRMHNSIC